MNIFDSIILGIVEGFTEFLPISSTAHLILTSKLLHLTSTEFLKSFEIIIQLGAIAAVVYVYRQRLILNWNFNKKILAAFLPTAIIGFTLYPLIKGVLLGNFLISVYALLVGGIIIVMFELLHKEKDEHTQDLDNITYKQALVIGLFQSLAVVPGVSRTAATIIGGMTLGVKRKTIVEFSFLLAVPTMIGASGLDLIKSYQTFSWSDLEILAVGFVVSFIMAILGIKFLMQFIQHNKFTSFGVYRIILALVFLFLYS